MVPELDPQGPVLGSKFCDCHPGRHASRRPVGAQTERIRQDERQSESLQPAGEAMQGLLENLGEP